jgi:hypothetical protein
MLLALGLSLFMLFGLVVAGDMFAADDVSAAGEPIVGAPVLSAVAQVVNAGDQPHYLPMTSSVANSSGNCRYGLAALGVEQIALVDDFASGLYLDFNYYGPPAAGAQYLPYVIVHEDKDDNGNYLGTYTARPSIETVDPTNPNSLFYWLNLNPGQLWTVGNEVERTFQGDLHAEVYAQAYHDVREYIKQHDPTARTAVSGLVQVTPIRLAYLDAFWEAHLDMFGFPPEVDVWNLHIYILPEVTPEGVPNNIASIPVGMEDMISLAKRESGGNPAQCPLDEVYCFAEHDDMTVFAEQVTDMRTWMYQHGERNKPLMLSEFSLLYPYEQDAGSCFIQDEYGNCFTPPRVQAFMDASLDWLESATSSTTGYPLDGNRLVQQWVWFSINNTSAAGSVSNLYEDNLTTIRPLGLVYEDRIAAIPGFVNLFGDSAAQIFAATDGSGTADVNIWAAFRNLGNNHVYEPFEVTFYRNAGLTNEIGTYSVEPEPEVAGCGNRDYRATSLWNNLPPGVHHFWAKIDAGNDIGESAEGDNVVAGRVFVDGEPLFLPINLFPGR